MMQCPSCQQGKLADAQLEQFLPCKTCNQCGGHWLLLIDYLAWQETTQFQEDAEQVDNKVEVDESTQALICPVTGTLMTKYRISSKTSHKIDFSMAANGIWLDSGEWDLLKQQNLAHKLNNIFTEPYQKHIRDELACENFALFYQHQFGEEAYKQIKSFREWLNQQAKRDEIIAYLIAEDPYAVIR